jgi:UDP-N-acetylmuramoyl-tripeptide--D-alanyl-D-alanine ligase
MNPLWLSEIRRITSSELSAADPDLQIAALCTDTRQMSPHSLFVAIRGENFDGHQFLQQARDSGAVAALVQDIPPKASEGFPLLRVPNTRAAMGQLARHIRRSLAAKVIAVAGSNGKTGTKHLVHSVLSADRRGSISPKSFNNDIGVPLAIFAADPSHDYLVLELGTNHPGEIANLTRIAEPDIAIITNCSAEHLEGLGDLAGVRRENAAILQALKPGGTLIVNGDDPALLQSVSAFPGNCLTFGFQKTNDLWVSDAHTSWDGTRFTIEPAGLTTFIPLLGLHNAANAIAAVAVARCMGLTDAQIVASLAAASAPEMRLQRMEAGGVRVLNDAYNANPASMKAAIEVFVSLPARGRRIAFLGDMRELGAASATCHREIGALVAKKFRPDVMVCVGAESRAIASEAMRLGFPARKIEQFPDAAAAQSFASNLKSGDVVLLKGSRAIGLEKICRAIVSSRQNKITVQETAAPTP